jgi:hypothetical protein
MAYPVIRQHGAHFSIFPISLWRALRGPAVYILGHDPGDFVVAPIYVGETEQLRGYMGPGHNKWPDALARGMNVICVHSEVRGERFRRKLEEILRLQYQPALNLESIPPSNRRCAALADALAHRRRYVVACGIQPERAGRQ